MIKLACTIANKSFQLIPELRIKTPVTTDLRVKTIEGPPTIPSRIFCNKFFFGFKGLIEFGTGIKVKTNFRQIRKCTPDFQHVNSFHVIKNQHFLQYFQCWDNVIVVFGKSL